MPDDVERISDLLKDREAIAAANQRIREFVAAHPDFIRDLKARDLAATVRDAVYEGDDDA